MCSPEDMHNLSPTPGSFHELDSQNLDPSRTCRQCPLSTTAPLGFLVGGFSDKTAFDFHDRL